MNTQSDNKPTHSVRSAKDLYQKARIALFASFKKRPVVSSVVSIVALLLLFTLFFGRSGSDETHAFHKVAKGDFLVTIVEGGELHAVNEVSVRNQVDGNSRIIYIIPEGTYVSKGDLIVRLDTAEAEKELNEQLLRYEDDKAGVIKAKSDVAITRSEVESDIRSAELAVKFAQMDLQKFEQIEREQEMRNAQMSIITAQESLKLAEERLEWSEKLTGEGFETKGNLDRDRLSVTNQSLGLEKAESIKKMLTEYDLAKLEAEYESELEEAKAELDRVKQQGESKILQDQASYDTAVRKLSLSEVKMNKMKDQMEATTMYAPQDGLIVYAVSSSRYSSESVIEEGAMIRQRQAIVTIPDTSKMKVEVKVHESHVNQVKVGQKAFVVLDSLPDSRFAGVVSKIAILPDQQGRYGNPNLKVYSTEILVTDKLPDVKPGVSAKAEIVVTNLKDVITVPIQCVTTVKGDQVVYTKGLRGVSPVEVEIGLFNNKFIEIVTGLEEGDRVLLSPPMDSSVDLGDSLVEGDENLDLTPDASFVPAASEENKQGQRNQNKGERAPRTGDGNESRGNRGNRDS